MGTLIMSQLIPLDLTATAVSNLFVDESHTLTSISNIDNRILIPNHGSFYRQGLRVRETTGAPLTHGKHYRFGKHDPDMSRLTGLDIETFIVITDSTVSDSVTVSYQAVGGSNTIDYDSLRDLLDAIKDSGLLHDFKDIVGLPEGYPGDVSHLHKYWQLYGMESLIENLELLGTALGDNRRGLISSTREYSDLYVARLENILDEYAENLKHLVDYDSPHETTKTHVGLSNIHNWRLATYGESSDKTIDNLYMPMSGAMSLLDTFLLPTLLAHVRDHNNPHNVTLEQLDLYSIQELEGIYNQRLLRTSGAYDTTLFAGRDLATFTRDVKTNLDASDIDPNTLFPAARAAVLSGTHANKVMTGDNQFTDIKKLTNRPDLEAEWVFLPNVAGSRAAAWNAIVATPAPEGRVLIKNYAQGYDRQTNYEILVGQRGPNGTTIRIFN